jgi:hypothetical protein
MTPKEQKEEMYDRLCERMMGIPEFKGDKAVIQETALYITSQLIQEREVMFYGRGIESGSYWQEVKAEIQKDIQAWKD